MIIIEFFANNATFIISSLALYLAVRAYVCSEKSKYEKLKSLLQIFSEELKTQRPWLDGNYQNTHEITWYSPKKIVYVLSFESAQAIINIGIINKNIISKKFYLTLVFFIERVKALNTLVIHQQNLISSNPILSQELIDFLPKEINTPSVDFCEWRTKINNDVTEKGKLAKMLYQGNQVIHDQLIGNKSNMACLSYMYSTLNDLINECLENYERRLPFWYRNISSLRIN